MGPFLGEHLGIDGGELKSAPQSATPEQLGSWKEIAAYLKRDVRTVQRWEKDEQLPVRRHPHKKLGTVYAYKAELDAWWEGHARLGEAAEFAPRAERSPRPKQPAASPTPTKGASRLSRQKYWFPIATLLALLASALLLTYWMEVERPKAEPASPKISGVAQITHDTFWIGSFATDGDYTYYTERVAGRTLLLSAPLSVSVGGPRTIPVAMAHPRILGISPDGPVLLLIDSALGRARPVMKLLLSEDRLVALNGVVASCASWSPDGESIAFCRGNGVYQASTSDRGPGPARLASFAGIPQAVAWSPDGESLRVLISQERPNSAGFDVPTLFLHQINVATRKIRSIPLPAGTSVECGASMTWPTRGNYFFLGSRCMESSSSLWLLPNRAGEIVHQSDWIRLGTDFSRITGVTWAGAQHDLLVLEAESGPLRLMRYSPRRETWTAVRLGLNPVEPKYSRDGRWIAYVEYPERTLWRVRAGGQDRLQLTFPPLRVQLPHWSPDGKTIAFSGDMPGNPWRIYSVGVNGGQVHAEIPSPISQGAPSWSPDGHAFVFGDIEFAGPNSYFLHRFDLDTGRLTNLPGSAGLRTARWSPDGRYIAAVRVARQELSLFDTRTEKWADVAPGVTGDSLSWSADSRYVYFDSPEDPYLGVFRFDLVRHRVEPVLKFGSYREGPDLDVDIGGFSLAPDGSLLLNVALQSSRIYSVQLKP